MVSVNMTSPNQKLHLSSDIEEEDFPLDFNRLAELYCDSTDRILLEDIDHVEIFPEVEEWLNTASTKTDDSFFRFNQYTNSTPGLLFVVFLCKY